MHHSPSRVEKPKKLRAACDFCRQSKVRCSGGNPCSGCKALNITCIYGTSNRMGRPRGAKNKKTIEKIQQYQAKVEQKLCKSATESICGSDNNPDTEDDERTFDLDNPFLESVDPSECSKLDFGPEDGESIDELDRLLDIQRDGSSEVGPSGVGRHGETGTDEVCEALARCGGFDVVDSAAIPWFDLPPVLNHYKGIDSGIDLDEHAGYSSRSGRSLGLYGQETTSLFTDIHSSAHDQKHESSMSTSTAQSPSSTISQSHFSTTSSGLNTPALSACTPTTDVSTYFSPHPDFDCLPSSKPALNMSAESSPSSRSASPTSCTCLHDQAALLSRIAITPSSTSSTSPDSTLATLKTATASWNTFLTCSPCRSAPRIGSCVDVLFVLASGMRLVIQAVEDVVSTIASPLEVSAAMKPNEAGAGPIAAWSCGNGSYQPSNSENVLVTATLILNGINQLYETCEKMGALIGEKSSGSQNAVEHRLECVNESFKAMEADVLMLRGRVGGRISGLLRWSV